MRSAPDCAPSGESGPNALRRILTENGHYDDRAKLAELARELDVTPEWLRILARGVQKPSTKLMRKLRERFRIPLDAWG